MVVVAAFLVFVLTSSWLMPMAPQAHQSIINNVQLTVGVVTVQTPGGTVTVPAHSLSPVLLDAKAAWAVGWAPANPLAVVSWGKTYTQSVWGYYTTSADGKNRDLNAVAKVIGPDDNGQYSVEFAKIAGSDAHINVYCKGVLQASDIGYAAIMVSAP